VRLAEQWPYVEDELPDGWSVARLVIVFDTDADAARAATILGPLAPGRTGRTFRLTLHARGADAATPDRLRRVLTRLDAQALEGRLDLVSADAEARDETGWRRPGRRPPLAVAWDELLARLPPDWSDLYAEVDLDSTDFLDRGALLLAPANPARYGGQKTLRFRAARRAGYGVAAEMARRCLERLDAEAITGTVRALRVLSDTDVPASTPSQGPVFRIGGRSV
jgi:hypothetical protein